ncbi:hypothetical protein [Pseudomonas oryzihabitans]|uniref:hypothetical protein n=1 Tax=Pseudomonas oryzihabitans TaxID=47885 RepID=UPI00111FC6A5|nr:hypothetical protein [Pseudomonas psychrotolerans]QDD88481.1 hypothetical protein CCZ28_05455 [Pseudomonas psychrotolerans]
MDTRPAVHLFGALFAPLQRLSPSAEAIRCLSARGRGQRIARATRQLLALGHRRILLVSGPEQDARLTNAYMYGHAQVMLTEGLPLLPRLELGATPEPIWPELLALLALLEELEELAPSVLLCTQEAVVADLESALRHHAGFAKLLIVGPEIRMTGPGAIRH